MTHGIRIVDMIHAGAAVKRGYMFELFNFLSSQASDLTFVTLAMTMDKALLNMCTSYV